MLSPAGRADRQPRESYNFILGVMLFLAPWVLGFAGQALAAWTAWATGVVGVLLSAIALFMTEATFEADSVSLVLGVWTVLAPWILGFASVGPALWSFVVVGILLVAVAAWEQWIDVPPRRAAT